MAGVLLFWNTNMAAVTSCENALSKERNFHLRITLTQQNPKILVYIPIQKIIRTMTNQSLKSYLQIASNNLLKIISLKF